MNGKKTPIGRALPRTVARGARGVADRRGALRPVTRGAQSAPAHPRGDGTWRSDVDGNVDRFTAVGECTRAAAVHLEKCTARDCTIRDTHGGRAPSRVDTSQMASSHRGSNPLVHSRLCGGRRQASTTMSMIASARRPNGQALGSPPRRPNRATDVTACPS